ncbi:MAG: taurine dioxygenase [Gammaproteobacteria bacterium]|jgi:taurine dioxygenase|nr:taurine dioxygenase [Gammaproteobacteria bacterium]MBT4494956.1 taurine dioxygenase [Gammaproteobacteria bacterium]MBT7370680.1 taurine dioxygenase [Gammaproteobacteria bacterium]
MTSIPSSWQVRRLAGALGAEVIGPDINNPAAADFEAVKELLLEHLVLFFPDQFPTPEAQIAFGRQFGELEGHPNLKANPELPPELFELRATSGGVADEWHTDLTFQEKPALMSILNMVTCPDTGGDTMWSSLYAAYDELSEPMKSLCDGLSALHDALPHNRPEQMTIHPVVRVHPATGRKALYVNEHFTRRIVEMNATESEAVLQYLTRWVTSPRFTVRYSWQPGTVGIWDNRCTQHFVLNDFEGERIIQRVTVVGDEVEAAESPRWQPWVREGRLSATSRHDRQLFMFLKAEKETT